MNLRQNSRQKKLLKKHETTKLFYNKYLYRLGIRNPLASIFRNKNFAYASTILDQLQQDFESAHDVTAACLTCHTKRDEEIMKTAFIPNERYKVGEIYKGKPIWHK